MLFHHGIMYLLARGVPGLFNFASLAVFTRLLSPEDYGSYTLTIAAVGAADSLLLRWLRLALLRFLPQDRPGSNTTLSTIHGLFLKIVGPTALMAVVIGFVFTDGTLRHLIILGALLLTCQGFFELSAEYERSSLSPMKYGWYSGIKSLISLGVGTGLALLGLGAVGLVIGLIVALLVPFLTLGSVGRWRQIWKNYDRSLVPMLVSYGLPLAATAMLGFVVSSSDRFMLAWLINTATAGEYAASYDFAQFSIGVLLSVVNLAAYPVVVSKLEQLGIEAAQSELQRTAYLLLLISVPAAAGLIMLSSNLSTVFIGPDFRATARAVLPVVAVAAIIAGFKSFYLDLAFQLGQETTKQVWIMLMASVVNVSLNLLLIPHLGLHGALYATLVAYVASALMSWRLGRRTFALPTPSPGVRYIFISALIMCFALWFVRSWEGPLALSMQITLGITSYFFGLLALDRTFLARLTVD